MSLNNADFSASLATANANSGYSPDEDTLDGDKLLTWYRDSARAQEEWRQNTVEALMMLNNKQWPPEILAQLPANMAPIVINILLSPLLYISGVQRQTREEPKIVATSGGDPRQAELMNELVHWVDSQTVAQETDSRVFLDKIALGLGWWKYTMNYSVPDVEGQIDLARRPALTIYPDPNIFDGRWSDAEYVFDSEFMSVDAACLRWPEYKEQLKSAPGDWITTPREKTADDYSNSADYSGDSFSDERLFWDPKTKKIRILECWYKTVKNQQVAVDLTQPEDPITDQKEVAQLKKAMEADPTLSQQYVLIKKPVTSVRVAHLFRDTKLDDNPSPCTATPDQFPIFPSIGYYFWKTPFGMVEIMKDLQREKNKRRSKLIELVGRMPLSGFLNKESDGANPKEIENYGSGNGIVINYKQTEPKPIRPPDLPQALIYLEETATKEVKEVTNVHDELLGQATQKTISGAAIEARQRGGFLSHEFLFDTFRLEQQQRVKFLIGMIQDYMSPTKALKILGSLAAQGNPQMEMLMNQATQDPTAAAGVMELLSNTFDAEYDVVVTSKPTSPSLAMEAWETLAQLKEKGAEIPPQTLWQAAQKAGLLNDAQVKEILGFIQQQQQAIQPPPGAAPPGMPPGMPAMPTPNGPAAPPQLPAPAEQQPPSTPAQP